MLVAPLPADEETRLKLLRTLQLLDSPAEPVFDRITRLAAQVLNVPIALVSLIDHDRQWFKSRFGLDASETPREYAFCAHAIHGEQVMVVEDAREDFRFADNPLVAGAPHIRFYAGAPLRSRDGIALGTLCIIDREPRQLTASERQTLDDFADLVQREIVHREIDLLSREIHQRSAEAAEQSAAYFRASFEQAAVGIAILGTDGGWIRVNDKLCDIVGYSADELLKLTFQDITHPDDLDTDLHLVAQVLAGELNSYTLEKRYVRGDGKVIWANLTVSLMRDPMGAPRNFISIIEDIHARKEAESELASLHRNLEERVDERTRQLRKSNELLVRSADHQRLSEISLRLREAQLAAALENAHDAYVAVDRDGLVAQWNRQAEIMLGWSRKEAIGRRFEDTIRVRNACTEWEAIRNNVQRGQAPVSGRVLQLDAMNRDGTLFPAELRISPLPIETGYLFCAFLQDITERKQLEQTLERRALHDALTGLPNRSALLDRLDAAVSRAQLSQQAFGVLFIDLDGFKAINDRYGHDGGDAVLQAFAQRLTGCVRKADLVARLAGDEFVILIEALDGRAEAELVGHKILHALDEPFYVQGERCHLGSSIGIYIQPSGSAISAQRVLKQADEAMYQAKRAGKNRIYLAAET